jgi:hypothetical protein
MGLIFRARFVQGFLVFFLIGAGLFAGVLGVLVLVDAVTGHGSHEGNMLTLTLGLSLLVPSSVFLILGINHWRRLSQFRARDVNM